MLGTKSEPGVMGNIFEDLFQEIAKFKE